MQEESISSLLLFDFVSTTFIPKDIVGKKVSKLRSIAELRAFYGIHTIESTTVYVPSLEKLGLSHPKLGTKTLIR